MWAFFSVTLFGEWKEIKRRKRKGTADNSEGKCTILGLNTQAWKKRPQNIGWLLSSAKWENQVTWWTTRNWTKGAWMTNGEPQPRSCEIILHWMIVTYVEQQGEGRDEHWEAKRHPNFVECLRICLTWPSTALIHCSHLVGKPRCLQCR